MSVRLRKWKTKAGKVLERWTIDVKVDLPGQRPRRIRDFSPVNARRGALQHERLVREALLAGTLGKEVKEVPTLEAFQDRFLDYAVVNNKPHGDFQFLTFEETERFLQAAAPEWKPFVTTALKTGLRVGELLALRWEDPDLVAGRLVVRRTLWQDQERTPKGGRIREVPLSDEAVATLQAHRHLRGPYVFCEPDGRRLNHNRVNQVVPGPARALASRSGSRRTTSGTPSRPTWSCAASRSRRSKSFSATRRST